MFSIEFVMTAETLFKVFNVRFLVYRLPGFYLTLAVFFTLSLLALIGILRGLLHKYFHTHL